MAEDREFYAFERVGMLGSILWLRLHNKAEDQRFFRAVLVGSRANNESLREARQLFLDLGLITTEGEAHQGKGEHSRVTMTLTKRGLQVADDVHKMNQLLRKTTGATMPIDTSVAKLDEKTCPILLTQRDRVWQVLFYLWEHADDVEARHRRRIEYFAPVAGHTFNDVRERLFDLKILEEVGQVRAGRGARLTYNLTDSGMKLVDLADGVEKVLVRARKAAPKASA